MNLHRPRAAYALLLLLASCSSSASDPTAQHDSGGPQDISDVIYVGGVTDEALVRLLDVAPKNDARYTVVIDSPDLGVPLQKDNPATLQFHSTSKLSLAPVPRVRSVGDAPSMWQRSFHELLQLLAPERIAHAHGTPYNGPAYYLVISGADSKRILQVFTSATSFTPESEDWKHLAQAPQPLSLKITSAIFEENSIPVDGGPFVGGAFPFRIEQAD